MLKVKMIMFFILIAILEGVAIVLGAITQTMHDVGVKNKNIGEIFKIGMKKLTSSPIQYIGDMIASRNPIFLLLAVGAIGAAAYIAFKIKTKEFEFERKYTVHGSNRFAEEKELITGQKLHFAKTKHILEDFYESVGEKNE